MVFKIHYYFILLIILYLLTIVINFKENGNEQKTYANTFPVTLHLNFSKSLHILFHLIFAISLQSTEDGGYYFILQMRNGFPEAKKQTNKQKKFH